MVPTAEATRAITKASPQHKCAILRQWSQLKGSGKHDSQPWDGSQDGRRCLVAAGFPCVSCATYRRKCKLRFMLRAVRPYLISWRGTFFLPASPPKIGSRRWRCIS